MALNSGHRVQSAISQIRNSKSAPKRVVVDNIGQRGDCRPILASEHSEIESSGDLCPVGIQAQFSDLAVIERVKRDSGDGVDVHCGTKL